MKYIRLQLIPICFLLLFIFSGIPRNTSAQGIDVGIIGGVNMSTHTHKFRFIDDDVNVAFSPKLVTGFHAGIIARKKISQSLRLQTEPSIIMLGARYNESFDLRGFEFQTESRTKLLYIQLPLLLQLTSVPPQQTVFGRQFAHTTYHISSGVFGGYQPYARFLGTNSGAPLGIAFEGDFSNDVSSQYESFDGGAIIGLGFEHGNRQKIGFEARALFSVIDSGDAPELSFNSQNLAFTFAFYVIL